MDGSLFEKFVSWKMFCNKTLNWTNRCVMLVNPDVGKFRTNAGSLRNYPYWDPYSRKNSLETDRAIQY